MANYYIKYIVTYKDKEYRCICEDVKSLVVRERSKSKAKKLLEKEVMEEYQEELISIKYADCYLTSDLARL